MLGTISLDYRLLHQELLLVMVIIVFVKLKYTLYT